MEVIQNYDSQVSEDTAIRLLDQLYPVTPNDVETQVSHYYP